MPDVVTVGGDDEYHFASITYTVAVLLASFTCVINGTFVGIKKNLISCLDTISFMILFTLGALSFALLLYLAEGRDAPEAYTFSTTNILRIFAAGMSMHLGDYFCFAASTKLHSATVMAFTNLPALFLPIAEYSINSTGVNLSWLWITGLIMALGLLLITASEFPETASFGMLKSETTPNHDEESVALITKDRDRDLDLPALPLKDSHAPAPIESISNTMCLVIGTIAGLLFCVWPLLDDAAESGSGSVKNPAIVLLIFISGEVGAVLIVLLIERNNVLRDWLASFSLGALCSFGYACYFYSISELPVPIAYSIYVLEVPIAAIAGVVLFGEYAQKSIDHYVFALAFILAGIGLYGVAIYYVLVEAYY
jgi:drug/metabolite transporter (DMT)-like permease